MKELGEIYPRLTAHQKAYILIGPRHKGWSFEDVREHVQESAGEEVDPGSIRRYLKERGVLLGESLPRRRPRQRTLRPSAKRTVDEQLARDAKKAESEGDFDPKNLAEGREWARRRINLRRGQPEFRTKLLKAYGNRCAVTGCDCPDALEAAHIHPYCGKDTNHTQNGLLLRSDIHTLFDLGRIGFDPVTGKVIVSASLRGTVYEKLEQESLRSPLQSKDRPNAVVLRKHLGYWELK